MKQTVSTRQVRTRPRWKKALGILGKVLVFSYIFVIDLLFFALFWAIGNYGNIDFDAIVFNLNMPLKGVSSSLLDSYLLCGLLPTVVIFCVILLWVLFPRKGKKGKWSLLPLRMPGWCTALVLVAATVALVWTADESFGFLDYVQNQFTSSAFIEEEYVDPDSVEITFPEEKRNLICIYLESAETSSQNIANGGLFEENYIQELTDIAYENVSFSQSDVLEGASVAPACGWTIAALVAQTSGVPLKLYAYDDGGTDNSMGRYAAFLPGVTSLGDILEEAGYKNVFMAGSDFRFGGRTSYFTQHGNYEIWDYYTAIAEGKIPKDYYVWWGFEDQKLYEYAKEELLELAAGDQPFNFTMLTVDTHHQDGCYCGLCDRRQFDTKYANVWACASRQLDDFLSWIQEQDFYENTTVVIVGDHCSMDSDFYGEVTSDKHDGSTVRKVYNAFVNAAVEPVQEQNRLFTTLDFFPTVLASLGVTIEGDRLGLGTNLFSDRQTLSEEYGYEYLFAELSKKSRFYDEELLYP